jgi:hypothetical protein
MAAHTIPQLRSTTLPPPNSTLERLMSTMPATAPDTAAHHRGAARLPHPLQQCGHEWPKPEGDDVAKRNTGGGHALIKSEGIDRCTNGAEDEPHPNPGVLYDGAGSPTADQRQNNAAHSHGRGTYGCRGHLGSEKKCGRTRRSPERCRQKNQRNGAMHGYPLWVLGTMTATNKPPVGDIMTSELHTAWLAHRRMIVVSQMAPTALLITTVALIQFGLADTSLALRVATAGILLASGILGALVQFQSATEAQTLARQTEELASSASWLGVVKYVTPAIFTVIFTALMVALFWL